MEYDGARYCGWQSQCGVLTVQDAVEKAIGQVANHSLRVVVAGRTDTHVHATGQIFHFDSSSVRTPFNWLRGTNTLLPDGIAIHWIQPVDSYFHARFAAVRRRYRYIICNQKVKPAIFNHLATWEHRLLNIEPMIAASRCLLGRHDFSAYRAVACQSKNPVKHLYKIDISRQDNWIWIDLEADGFLHHMVRNIAGVLMAIGAGERPVGWCEEVLASGDRRAGGVTARPNGLYLTGVDYPREYGLPATPTAPGFW